MTGYESKRAAAQAKTIDQVNWADHELDDDDTQVYQDHDDALTIAYQSGYYDGKKAAQPAQETAIGDIRALKHRIHELEGEVIGYKQILDAQPEQEPVAKFDEVWDSIDWDKWRMEPIREVVKMIHSKTTPPQRKPLTEDRIWEIKLKSHQKFMSRKWVEETDTCSGHYEDVERHTDSPVTFARAIEAAHDIKE